MNLAWQTAIDLGLNLDEADYFDRDDKDTVPDQYWAAAQRPLSTAVSLLQQGIEFLIKARIAAVSPFLLIDGSPRDWPSKCNQVDTPYSVFKTIDAQDLIRAHNTLCTPRLLDAFVSTYERLRKRRNTIMHTVDPTLRFTATEVLVDVLEISEVFTGPNKWTAHRAEAIDAEPCSVAYWGGSCIVRLARECLYATQELEPAQCLRFFGFNARQRRYRCYNCQLENSDSDIVVDTAQLQPNTPTSITVHCFVCRGNYDVVRQKCPKRGCKGNVLDAEDRICLTCFN
nr:hypothetical protein [Pirellula staleyi]